MSHNQVFQYWEFPIDCHGKLLQIPDSREAKAEVADTITLVESKH